MRRSTAFCKRPTICSPVSGSNSPRRHTMPVSRSTQWRRYMRFRCCSSWVSPASVWSCCTACRTARAKFSGLAWVATMFIHSPRVATFFFSASERWAIAWVTASTCATETFPWLSAAPSWGTSDNVSTRATPRFASDLVTPRDEASTSAGTTAGDLLASCCRRFVNESLWVSTQAET